MKIPSDPAFHQSLTAAAAAARGDQRGTMARQQLQVLSTLDAAKTQWYHFTAIVVAGMGFFTDAYDLFCISLVTKLLGRIYYTDLSKPDLGTLPPNVAAAVNGVALCGTLAGQLFFGWLGDKLGRKSVYGMTLLLMVACSVASGLSFGSTPAAVMATLCFFRFWLGFGIGGDYPLSATIMSEYANKKTRGGFIAAVFAMQGFGIVTLAISTAFRMAFPAPAYTVDAAASTVPQADYVWRLILMLGAAPAILTYYWRMKMPETARYTALVAKNAKQAASDMSKVLQVEIEADSSEKLDEITGGDMDYGLFSSRFARCHGVHLLGTAASWFLVDIAYYSQNLFQKDIFTSIHWIPKARTMSALEEVFRISRAQTVIALCGTVPGYWFTVFLIDTLGRFAIQLMGFAMMTVFMLGLAVPYHHWTTPGNHVGFAVMYGFTFFFANFGPNATTFIVPAKIFPARLRSTCHGISAAAGKAGAIVGAFGFLYAAQSPDEAHVDAGYKPGIGVQNSLFVLAVSNFLGFLFTFLVPESKGKSLEEMSGEANDDEETSGNDGAKPPGMEMAGAISGSYMWHRPSPSPGTDLPNVQTAPGAARIGGGGVRSMEGSAGCTAEPERSAVAAGRQRGLAGHSVRPIPRQGRIARLQRESSPGARLIDIRGNPAKQPCSWLHLSAGHGGLVWCTPSPYTPSAHRKNSAAVAGSRKHLAE
ncbi:hypothetical protein HU200_023867 [Digitaria exilis]|uniref:H(+)/Pi cotransporter n=1 Tax=Digitaria exilis TaxID=1010633 RepID=A0A835EU18_9POAL|nr:hypothetical protein HU200_023867 [Digitaria exilis]